MAASEHVPRTDIALRRHGDGERAVVFVHGFLDDQYVWDKVIAARRDRPAASSASTALRAWAVGGVAAADEAMFDVALPLFESDDVKTALPEAVEAFKAGRSRPAFDFQGR